MYFQKRFAQWCKLQSTDMTVLRTEGFVKAKFYYPHALADELQLSLHKLILYVNFK